MLLLALVAGGAQAHSHSPTNFGGPENPIDAITTTGVVTIPIAIGNLNQFPQAYEVYVDDELVGTTSEVAPNLYRKLPIPVTLDTPNTPEVHKVCSVSVARDGDMFRSKICTKAKLYWKK